MENNTDSVQAVVDRMKEALGFTADTQLSEYLGSGRSTPSGWKGRGIMPFKECMQIAVDRGVSLDWLVLGRGKQHTMETPEPLEAPRTLDALEHVNLPVMDMRRFDSNTSLGSWRVPLLWLGQEDLKPLDTMMVRAAGDAMQPTIMDGDMVMVDRRPCDTDGVFLLRFGGVVRIKRIQRMVDGSLRLISDNPAYPADVVKPGDESSIEIIGYCRASVRPVQ